MDNQLETKSVELVCQCPASYLELYSRMSADVLSCVIWRLTLDVLLPSALLLLLLKIQTTHQFHRQIEQRN